MSPSGKVIDLSVILPALMIGGVGLARGTMPGVVMGPALPVVPPDAHLDEIAKKLGNGSPAVLVEQPNGYGIITKQDIIGKLR